MDNNQPTGNLLIVIELIEYKPGEDPTKTIIRKNKNDVTATTFISDDVFVENTSSVDTYIQVLEGQLELMIDDVIKTIDDGNSILVPAHSQKKIIAKLAFKITSTVLKTVRT